MSPRKQALAKVRRKKQICALCDSVYYAENHPDSPNCTIRRVGNEMRAAGWARCGHASGWLARRGVSVRYEPGRVVADVVRGKVTTGMVPFAPEWAVRVLDFCGQPGSRWEAYRRERLIALAQRDEVFRASLDTVLRLGGMNAVVPVAWWAEGQYLAELVLIAEELHMTRSQAKVRALANAIRAQRGYPASRHDQEVMTPFRKWGLV